MLKKLFEKLFGSSEPELTEKQKFERANGISYHFGFACHNLLVREFNHHLRHYSNGAVDDFDNVAKVIQSKDVVIRNVETGLANNNVAETGLIENETALMNARNFLKIFETVVEYNLRFNPEFYYLK
ncbi:hypothetical protein QDT13_003809 [Acinetobacter baumannii]|uniref:hypothetical protein n=1 Tax=Acinetobacter TaxID=469 RepID=UPI0013B09957|nr:MULTISPECIES: hypothetical protein [Acinetobacter]EKV3807063.1 hypothetical protein [Acinetobacter baumannii]EKV3807860.1 hypothetical protein [Acinetobacter baumannii]EKW1173357.1 hypothetical protein [Acinetobacter baumannii]EKW1174084.1 hypothetical protein [Acinetobacter baumannii]MBI1411316.1 hypothetical protein [Acinetobacter baumannii]